MKRENGKKQIKRFMSVLLATVTAFAMIACGRKEEPAAASVSEEVTAPAKTITVTFMHGEDVLGKVEAEAGKVLDPSTYSSFEEVEDGVFAGWYKTPTYLEVSKKDLTVDTFDEDTKLYACIKSSVVSEDTRKWYIVGSSSFEGPLKASAWADANADDATKAAAELTSTGNMNEFSITIDLYKGDEFQVIPDWGWEGQLGFGYLSEFDESCLESGGGLSGVAKTSNIKVLTDGNYTLTITTNPDDEALTTFKAVRNSDPLNEASAAEEEPYVVNENTGVKVKGSWVADWSELKDLTANGDGTFTIEMELEAGTELYFSVFDGDTDTGLGFKGSNVTDADSLALLEDADNVKVSADGTYVFTVDVNNGTITVALK